MAHRLNSSGFTRIDLLVCVLTAGVLFAAMASAFSRMAGRQDEVVCANNLRLITQGFTAFANEHQERYPWQVTSWRQEVFAANVFFKFFAISNHLQSPQVLADPADQRLPDEPRLNIASTWGDGPDGLVNPNYRNSAISYFVAQYATPLHPQTFLAGDRNTIATREGDSSLFGPRHAIDPPAAGWADRVHGLMGHVAFTDGAVERTDTPRLREIVAWWGTQAVYIQKPTFN